MNRGNIRAKLLLLLILASALALRLYDVNWDEYQHAHPDERWITMVAITIHLPEDWRDAFNPRRSPFNPLYDPVADQPRNFAYGHLPLYLLTIIAGVLSALAPVVRPLSPSLATLLAHLPDYDHINLLGRVISAFIDTGTVYLVYLLGKRLYNTATGLLAAAFVAFTVSHIQLAHFYAFDPVATFFIVLAVYFSVRLAQEGSARYALLAGAAAGMAVSSKFSAMPVLAAVAVAALISRCPGAFPFSAPGFKEGFSGGHPPAPPALRSEPPAPGFKEGFSGGHPLAPWQLLLLAMLAAFVAFAITSPFAILDFKAYVAQIVEQGKMVRGEADFPYTRQYRGTTPFVYQIEQELRWGMGWALGITAFAGFAWTLWRGLRNRLTPAEWVILAWLVPYFALTGSFMVKFMRYMLPLLPFFSLMGARLALSLGEKKRSSIATKLLSKSAVPLVLIPTILWALAFVNGVYGDTHPWIAASRWIYRNIPDGSVIAVEHWDDELPKPLREPGMNSAAHRYRHVTLPLYEEDTEQKFEIIKSVLRQADYIVIASNRLYRSIPRLPPRYPMTIRYYELLFAGKLGFEKVAEFTAYPRLGPWVVPDDDADESFTVYDHPKPMVFKKVRELSDEEWWQLLGGTWEGAIPGYVGGPVDKKRHRRPSLLLNTPVEKLPVIDDFRWNRPASTSPIIAIVVWWLAIEAVGLAAWPLAFFIFRRLHARGYILSKSLGLLLIAYINWILASLRLARNTAVTVYLCLALVAALSYALWRRHRREMADFWRENRRGILLSEALFAGAYLAFVFIRMLNPDLWHPWNGGEKPMELAFLNAILKSAHFPPYDPYYAGGYINYYYYGQYIVSVLIKLTGIKPTVAFNLAVPVLFALTVVNAFCIGASLGYPGTLAPQRLNREDSLRPAGPGTPESRHLGTSTVGFLAALFVALIGNLASFRQILQKLAEASRMEFHSNIPFLDEFIRAVPGLFKVLESGQIPKFNYWEPSRVIPYTINEFPFWSFLFADLHPHLIGMPFTIFFVALVLEAFLEGFRGWKSSFRYLLLPFTLGTLAVVNTWDLPTYLLLAFLACLLATYRREGEFKLVEGGVFGVLLLILALGPYLPFFLHYKALHAGVGRVRAPTDWEAFITIWGFFLFVVLVAGLKALKEPTRTLPVRLVSAGLRRWERLPRFLHLHLILVRRTGPGYRAGLWLMGITMAAGVALAARHLWVPLTLLAAITPVVFLLLRRDAAEGEEFAFLLVGIALAVLMGCEFFFFKDFLQGGPHYRMNTLFKFYIQAWVLLGLGIAPLAYRYILQEGSHLSSVERAEGAGQSIPGPRRSPPSLRLKPALDWACYGVFTFLLAISLIFPIVGAVARVNDRFPNATPPFGTLDGMEFMRYGEYFWPSPEHPIRLRYDYEAIKWLLRHVRGTPVVAEAPLGYYREFGCRVASFTGLPTLLGMHQNEQRYGDQVGLRAGEANEFFTNPDIQRTLQLIRRLRIRYIYIGQLERIAYQPAALAKFEEMARQGLLEVVFRNEGTVIYRTVTLP